MEVLRNEKDHSSNPIASPDGMRYTASRIVAGAAGAVRSSLFGVWRRIQRRIADAYRWEVESGPSQSSDDSGFADHADLYRPIASQSGCGNATNHGGDCIPSHHRNCPESDQTMTNIVADTAVQTAEVLLPTILAAAGTAASPQVAGIVALAPVAMQLLQSAIQLQSVGAMTSDQLAALFASIGQGIHATHDKWVALNAAPVPSVPTIV